MRWAWLHGEGLCSGPEQETMMDAVFAVLLLAEAL